MHGKQKTCRTKIKMANDISDGDYPRHKRNQC